MPDPSSTPAAATPSEIFEASLPRIDRIVGAAARRLALRGPDREDFASWVHLRLIEDDYAVLRKFGGRSSLATYLHVVIQNLARDYRIRNWGRWRPSAAAERLGVDAVRLEILCERDGFSLDEAVEKLISDFGTRKSRRHLLGLAARLPPRTRTVLEGGDRLASIAAADRADAGVEGEERRTALDRARRVVDRALAELAVDDRLILRMHYQSGLTISAIARALGHRQRELYTRRDRCLRRLRRALEAEGLPVAEVLDALGWGEADLRFDFDPPPEDRNPDPSNGMEPSPEDDP